MEKYFPHYSEIGERFPAFAKAYDARKREQKVCDYDDLLELWLALLRKSPEVAQYFSHRFRHVLVDEYQDTNTLQAQIVDTIASHHRVMAVGDDAQCIYSWRGANFENIMTFPERHPGTAIHRIETNYRSTPEILRPGERRPRGPAQGAAFRQGAPGRRAATWRSPSSSRRWTTASRRSSSSSASGRSTRTRGCP